MDDVEKAYLLNKIRALRTGARRAQGFARQVAPKRAARGSHNPIPGVKPRRAASTTSRAAKPAGPTGLPVKSVNTVKPVQNVKTLTNKPAPPKPKVAKPPTPGPSTKPKVDPDVAANYATAKRAKKPTPTAPLRQTGSPVNHTAWATPGQKPNLFRKRNLGGTHSATRDASGTMHNVSSEVTGRKSNPFWNAARTTTTTVQRQGKNGKQTTAVSRQTRRGSLTQTGRNTVIAGGAGTAGVGIGTSRERRRVNKTAGLLRRVTSGTLSQGYSQNGNRKSAKKVIGKSAPLELGWATQVSKADPDQADVSIMGRSLKKKRARIR